MTPNELYLFLKKNLHLPIVELDRYIILPPLPPLIFINKTRRLYFNDNKLLVSENNSDMSRVHITRICIKEILIKKNSLLLP